MELRKSGKEAGAIPITPRQIEGLIRLAEASAKARLSTTVDLMDADRSIALMTYVQKEIFTDRETGKLDMDIVNIGQTKARTDRVRTLLDIVRSLESKYDMVDIDRVLSEAVKINIDETTARKLLDDLRTKGELFQPKPGMIKTVRE